MRWVRGPRQCVRQRLHGVEFTESPAGFLLGEPQRTTLSPPPTVAFVHACRVSHDNNEQCRTRDFATVW